MYQFIAVDVSPRGQWVVGIGRYIRKLHLIMVIIRSQTVAEGDLTNLHNPSAAQGTLYTSGQELPKHEEGGLMVQNRGVEGINRVPLCFPVSSAVDPIHRPAFLVLAGMAARRCRY